MPIWTVPQRQACGRALPSVLLVGILLVGVLVTGWRTNGVDLAFDAREDNQLSQALGRLLAGEEGVQVRTVQGRSFWQIDPRSRKKDGAPDMAGQLRIASDLCGDGRQTSS